MPESDPTTLVVPTTSISSQLDPVSPNAGNQLYVVRKGKVALVDAGTGELRDFAGRPRHRSRSPRSPSRSPTPTSPRSPPAARGSSRRRRRRPAGRPGRSCPGSRGWRGRSSPGSGSCGRWAARTAGSSCGASSTTRPTVVNAPELAGRDITAFRFSPDGVRIAFLERTARWLADRGRPGQPGRRVDIEGAARARHHPGRHAAADAAARTSAGSTRPTCSCSGRRTTKETASPYAVSEDASTITDQGEALVLGPGRSVAVLLRTQSAIVRSSERADLARPGHDLGAVRRGRRRGRLPGLTRRAGRPQDGSGRRSGRPQAAAGSGTSGGPRATTLLDVTADPSVRSLALARPPPATCCSARAATAAAAPAWTLCDDCRADLAASRGPARRAPTPARRASRGPGRRGRTTRWPAVWSARTRNVPRWV